MSQVILPRSGILAFMDDEARGRFATYGTFVMTSPGEVLIRENDVNRQLYIIVSGSFNITTQTAGTQVHLDTVSAGDCLGEVAIFNPDRASATVTSLHSGKLWMIEVESFQEFLIEWPNHGCAALLGIDIILSRRLKRANAVIRSNEIVPGFLSVRAQKRVVGKKLG